MTLSSPSLNPDEIQKFSQQAGFWWDESGPFKSLHHLNPLRLQFIRDHCRRYFNLPEATLKGLEILDIGCGGGLVCEPLCRLGATVTGVDGSGDAIQVATDHAQAQNLPITYIHASIEDLSAKNHPPVDVVTALEIVEHVADLDSFIAHAASLLKPGGLFFFSTLNRTFKSLALGKVAAEYIVRLVPPGTHQWRKFVRPSEMDRHFRNNHIHLTDLKGVVFNPFKREWSLSSDLSVNYMGCGITNIGQQDIPHFK